MWIIPAFGAAVIGRIIQSEGLRVGIIPQPNWQDDLRDFKKFGRPKLFFGVTSGCMDTMVNHYTASRRRRSTDAYTPGNESWLSSRLCSGYLYEDIERALSRCTCAHWWYRSIIEKSDAL